MFAGIAVCGVGLTAMTLAFDFDTASRVFPATLAGLLTLAGLALIAMSFWRNNRRSPNGGFRAATAVATVSMAWAAAVSFGGGFLVPTFLMQFALLWLTGIRKLWLTATCAMLITAAAYVLFAILLNVPLPAARLPTP